MAKEIKAYGCDFCGMASRRKSSVVRHEKHACKSNPNRKSCSTCKHLEYVVYNCPMQGHMDACMECGIDLDSFNSNRINQNENNSCEGFEHRYLA